MISREEENLKDVSSILNIKAIDPLLSEKVNTVFSDDPSSFARYSLSILKKLVQPNLTFNKEETDKKILSAIEEVKPVYFQVQKNEMIVREGEKIGYPELAKLEAFYKTVADNKISGLSVILGIFCTVFFLSLLLYFWRTRNWLKAPARSNLDFLVFAIVAVLQIVLVKMGIFISVAVNRAFPFIPVDAGYFAIPFACGAMIIAVLVNRNVAMIMSVLISFLISFLFEEKIIFPLFSFIGSVASSYHIVNSRQRSTFFKVGLFLGVINIAAIFCLNLLSGHFLNDLPVRLAMGILGGMITGVLFAGLTPLFESIFGFITYIKLLELANLNQPIFQRMIIEAPGTYHHSIIVASLVEAAADAIGANALLAKVSAYYHDIGKLAKPHYYIENQTNHENRHDKLSPKMSTLIIISHIKEGCELAEKEKLGQPISTSFGNTTDQSGRHFYKSQRTRTNPFVLLRKAIFVITAPSPRRKKRTRELVTLLKHPLALTHPTPENHSGADRQHSDGQLDDCELTLKIYTIVIFLPDFHGIFITASIIRNIRKESNEKESNENPNRKSAETY